jgi:hypothetical protein
MRKFLAVALCIWIIAAAPALLLVKTTIGQVDYASVAIDYLAKQQGLDKSDLSVIHSTFHNYSMLGVTVWEGKVQHKPSHKMFGVSIGQDGQVMKDQKTIEEQEATLYLQKYGRQTRALADRLQQLGVSQTIEIAFMLKIDTPPPIRTPKSPTIDLSAQTKRVSTAEAGLLQWLNSKGYPVKYASIYEPIVFATLPASEVNGLTRDETMVQSLSIGFADIERTERQPHVNTMVRTIYDHLVKQRGISGQGVKVAVVEDDRVSTSTYLPSVTYKGSGSTGQHSTGVAGVIASTYRSPSGLGTDTDFRGIAYLDASHTPSIYSADSGSFSDSAIVAACDWAVSQGVTILNHSWGGNYPVGALEAYMDHLVWDMARTQIISSGNQPNTGSYNVDNPGCAANVITVGSYTDTNTPTWKDDALSWFSCYIDSNGYGGDFNKPEVMGIGELVTSTSMYSPWVLANYAGTSFSAPMVAGVAANMQSRSTWLQGWPEATKAVIMASCRESVSDIDHQGSGCVNALAADDILINAWADATMYNRDPGWGQYPDAYIWGHTITGVVAGERVKAALCWDRHGTGYGSGDPLKADLDLVVISPTSSYYYWSPSWDNSYEWVDFVAPESGNYAIYVNAYSWDTDNPSEYLGLAYWHENSGSYPYQYYFPHLADDPARGWVGQLSLMNRGSYKALFLATTYRDGASAVSILGAIAPNQQVTGRPATWYGLSGVWGSMIVQSTEELGACFEYMSAPYMANRYVPFKGTYPNYYGPSAPEIILPYVYDDTSPWRTFISIFNPNDASVTFSASVYNEAGSLLNTYSTTVSSKGRWQGYARSLNNNNLFKGSVVVRVTSSPAYNVFIAVLSAVSDNTRAEAYTAYPPYTDGSIV